MKERMTQILARKGKNTANLMSGQNICWLSPIAVTEASIGSLEEKKVVFRLQKMFFSLFCG
jgi:hypothetical protein